MKYRLAIVGSLAIGWVAPLGGESIDCVPHQRCAENQKPPACCQPPPCQIFEQLRQMRAMRRMVSGDRAARALRRSKGDHKQAIAELRNASQTEAGKLKTESKCKFAPQYAAPNFRLTGCELEVQKAAGWSKVEGALSLLDEFDMCNEMVEAEFARWNHVQESCVPGMPANVKTWAARTRNSSQDAIDSTMAHLQRYWSGCSSVMDEAGRRQLEDLGMTMEDGPYLQYLGTVLDQLLQTGGKR